MIEAKANLLATCDPSHPSESQVEARDLLNAVHGRVWIVGSVARGVIKLAAEEDSRKVVRRLRYLFGIQPERFSYTTSWVPVDMWCGGDPDEIVELASRVADGIGRGETWKMVLKRTECPSGNLVPLVERLSRRIARPRPDLTNPERILYIHRIGQETAISLLRSDEILEIPCQPTGLSIDSTGDNGVLVGRNDTSGAI